MSKSFSFLALFTFWGPYSLFSHLSFAAQGSRPSSPGQVRKAYAAQQSRERFEEAHLKDKVIEFLPIVHHEVMRFRFRLPSHIEQEELQGVAVCGLMKALTTHSGEDQTTLAAYVRQRVRGAILDELRRMDVFTRTTRKKARLYDETVQRIEQKEGRMATEDEVRAELGLSPSDFGALLETLRPISFLSLNATDTYPSEVPLQEKVGDTRETPAPDLMEKEEGLDLLRERISALPEIQQKILHMYYFKDYRLAEIAAAFNLTEGRICQLHTQALRTLRIFFMHHRKREEDVS